MGFFDRFSSKKPQTPPAASTPAPAPVPAPASAPSTEPSPTPAPANPSPAATTSPIVKNQLLRAREFLEARKIDEAMALYEEVLVSAGDRADVLVTISGDLGSCGYVTQIIDLVAPRYDAERHGPATGLNLLQAYLVTHNPDAAQHLLDVLFALERPELEKRLHGFSNALGELIEAINRGEVAPNTVAVGVGENGAPQAPQEHKGPKMISLASISKPIWAYGIEDVPGVLPPAKSNKVRRVAFAQLALIESGNPRVEAAEDEVTRFTRGFALWLSETLYFCPHYSSIAAIGLLGKERLANFPQEWTADNLRQLVASSSEPLDYIFSGSLRIVGEETNLTLRLWEVKKFKERKVFSAKWTPATANTELLQLHEQLRLFMEVAPYPGGPAYVLPKNPVAWCDTLGLSLSLFLADKGVLPADQVPTPSETGARLAIRASETERDTLAWYTALARAGRLQLANQFPGAASPLEGPLVDAAKNALGL